MIIKVNEVDITSRLLGFKTLNEMNSDSLLLGNAVCKKLELKLDNQDGELTALLDYPFFVNYSENKALGKFYVYEKPEKYTGILSLTLYDNMYLFNQRYDTQLDYSVGTTIGAQLDEMATLTGETIDKSNLSLATLNKLVEWYDNTVTMRNYIGWIAELDGCNAFANESGTIIFKSLATSLYETIDVETYEKGEMVIISRVCFDDGVLKLEKGTSEGNTLYLSSNNAYVDSETDLNPIFEKYQGLTFYSIKDLKMASIDNLYLTDLINYNNEFLFMPLSIDEVYGGGQYSIATVNGVINTVNQEITVNKVDISTKVRRIQTVVDRNEATMEVIAQTVENNAEQIGKLLISNEQIQTKVEEVEKRNSVATITPQYAVTTDKLIEPSKDDWIESKPDMNVSEYLWMREMYTYQDGKIEYTLARVVSGQDGKDGEPATLLRINSSKGTVFKNNQIATVLSVVIYYGNQMITDIETLKATYGSGAYIEWKWQRLDEETFGTISSTDSRIQNNEFSFVLSADDVDTKVTFMCELNY